MASAKWRPFCFSLNVLVPGDTCIYTSELSDLSSAEVMHCHSVQEKVITQIKTALLSTESVSGLQCVNSLWVYDLEYLPSPHYI